MSTGSSVLPVVVLVLAAAVWGWAVVDLARADEREVRTFPKQVWVVVVVLGSVVGSVLWFAAGRPEHPRR